MLKRRPKEMLDLQQRTFNTKMARNDQIWSSVQKKLADDRAFQELLLKEMKMSFRSFTNRLMDENEEKCVIETRQKKQENSEQLRLQSAMYDLRWREKEKLRQEQLAEERRRQQVLQKSNEFQEFQRQIQRAQTAKAQTMQIFNKQAEIKMTKEINKDDRLKMEREKEQLDALDQQKSQSKMKEERGRQMILQKQMDEQKAHKLVQERLDKQAARKQMGELAKELQEEQRRSIEERLQKRKHVQQVYEDYWVLRNRHRDRERLKEQQEEKRIMEHYKHQQNRDTMQKDSKNDRFQRLETLKEKLANLIREEQCRKEAIEQKHLQKQILEIEEKSRQRDKEEFYKEQQKRVLVRSSILQQLKRREHQLYQELAEEEHYRQLIKAEMDKDRQNRQTVRRANEKQLLYLKELQRMMNEMKTRREKEKLIDQEYIKQSEEQHQSEENIVKMEKQKLLKNKLESYNEWDHFPNLNSNNLTS